MDTNTTNVLLIEEDPGDVRLVRELLHENGRNLFSLKHTDQVGQALEDIAQNQFDCLLLGLSLSHDGETIQKVCGAAPQLPVIVLNGMIDHALGIEAVQFGAQDYLFKNELNHSLLTRSMNYAIERKRLAERMQFTVLYDRLTGLPNRTLFQDRLRHAIKFSLRSRFAHEDKWKIVVMQVCLDNFRFINAKFGRSEGDLLLQQIAKRIQKSIRKSDTVARMEGGNFMLAFENVTCKEDVDFLGRKILNLFSEPFQLSSQPLKTTASIGISYFPDDGEDCQSLMHAAETAMRTAKRKHNCYRLFSECKQETAASTFF